MARMLHLRQTGVQYGPHQGVGALGSQLEPCPQSGTVIVGRLLDELDAQVAAGDCPLVG
jgi:hypothetical protein